MRGDPNDSTFIRTFTGRFFWPLEPRAEDVCIEDIAHALALQCRWTGHTMYHFSVAQHSVHVSEQVPTLRALLHDASEAYLSDLARPIKHAPGLGQVYREVEERLDRVICEAFGLDPEMPKELKLADNLLLWTEKRDLMAGDWNERLAGAPQTLPGRLPQWAPEEAEENFLARFQALSNPLSN